MKIAIIKNKTVAVQLNFGELTSLPTFKLVELLSEYTDNLNQLEADYKELKAEYGTSLRESLKDPTKLKQHPHQINTKLSELKQKKTELENLNAQIKEIETVIHYQSHLIQKSINFVIKEEHEFQKKTKDIDIFLLQLVFELTRDLLKCQINQSIKYNELKSEKHMGYVPLILEEFLKITETSLDSVTEMLNKQREMRNALKDKKVVEKSIQELAETKTILNSRKKRLQSWIENPTIPLERIQEFIFNACKHSPKFISDTDFPSAMFSMLMAIGSTTSIQQIIDMHDKKLISRPLIDGIPPLFYATLDRNPELLMLLLSKKPKLSYTFNPNRNLRITYPDIDTEKHEDKLFIPANGDIFTFLAATNQLALFLKAATVILNEPEFSNELSQISESDFGKKWEKKWNKEKLDVASHYFVILNAFSVLLIENSINESIKTEITKFLDTVIVQLESGGLNIPQIIQLLSFIALNNNYLPSNTTYLLYYFHHHFIRTTPAILNNHPLSTVEITENEDPILNQVKQQECRCILRPYNYLQSLASKDTVTTKQILAELSTLADMKIIKRFIKDALYIIENMSLEKLTENQFKQWLTEIHWETIEPATSVASIYKLLTPILGSDVIAKYDAVFKIQSLFRMAPVRRDYKTIIKGVTQLQGLQRIKFSKKVLTQKLMNKTQTEAAIKIQTFLIQYIYKIKSKVISKPIQDWENKSLDFWTSHAQKRKKEANAIKIQSAHRTFKKKSTFKQQQQASLTIQTNWRRYRSQNKFNQMKHAITKIQQQTRNMLKNQRDIQNNAALKINKALTPLFRRVKAREKTKALIAQFKEADNALITGLEKIESTINSQADMMFYKTKNSHVFGIINKENTYLIAGKMGTVFMKNNQIHTGFAYLGEKTAQNISVTIIMNNKTPVTKKFKCYLVQEQRFDRKICHKYGIKIRKIRSEMMKLV